MCESSLERYQKDHDRRSLHRIIEGNRALVASVARRFLRDPHDVDDVVQDTFLKFASQAPSLRGSLTAWLAATAQSRSVDLIRRSARERRRRIESARCAASDLRSAEVFESIRLRLDQAMLALRPAARELLLARFVRSVPLRVLAVAGNCSIATMSRRVQDAIGELAGVLRDLGVESADEQVVVQQFDLPGDLRFAPDWRTAELSPLTVAATPIGLLLPGWSRPMRVGAMISYSTLMLRHVGGGFATAGIQLHLTLAMPVAGVQLVGIVEPGTSHQGVIEGSLRDFGLLGGLIEADDAESLRTLDVILLGNYTARMSPTIARAIVDAVRSGGVGLLNECWAGRSEGAYDDPDLMAIMLADSPVYPHHTPGRCCLPRPATVLRDDRLLPGLRAGTKLIVDGCGPAYRPLRHARVLVARDEQLTQEKHRVEGLGPLPMPVYVVGELGKGRVAIVQNWPHWGLRQPFASTFNVSYQQYTQNLLNWLAEPRCTTG
jgi:RNA polymerase sigma factor (sigma-70 family)